MKILSRFLLILWGITFSTDEPQQIIAQKPVGCVPFLSEKITQTCDAIDAADSLTTT